MPSLPRNISGACHHCTSSHQQLQHLLCFFFLLVRNGNLISEVGLQVLTTQGSTKVYKRKRQEDICTQRLECTVAASAFIAILPGPVTCFRDANFDQKQIFRVAAHGSLVLVDWYTSGREGYGESWYVRSNKRPQRAKGVTPYFLSLILFSPPV
jgi:hypothetical protein